MSNVSKPDNRCFKITITAEESPSFIGQGAG